MESIYYYLFSFNLMAFSCVSNIVVIFYSIFLVPGIKQFVCGMHGSKKYPDKQKSQKLKTPNSEF